MAENEQLVDVNSGGEQVSTQTLIYATLAGLAVEGPLLGMMGFSFLTTLMLLVVTSPLLLIFSPLLFGAASVLAFAMTGFGVAGAMAVLGLSSFVLVYRSVIEGVRRTGIYYTDTDVPVTVDKMIDETAKEQQHDTEASGSEGSVDRIEAAAETVKEEQQQDTSVPITVDKMVELFESLKEHPHDTTDEAEEHQHDKDRASSSGYLQQNVQRVIPQVI